MTICSEYMGAFEARRHVQAVRHKRRGRARSERRAERDDYGWVMIEGAASEARRHAQARTNYSPSAGGVHEARYEQNFSDG